jgi:Spore coat polysaccharide biosynthesis protein, predicted glycosyltransferase
MKQSNKRKPEMDLAIRVDGGAKIGYGHLIRSGVLAEEFLSHNHTVTITTTTPQPARAVFPDAAKIVKLPSRDDPEPFIEWLETASPDLVFTDAYPINTTYQQAVREHTSIAVLQDDRPTRRLCGPVHKREPVRTRSELRMHR